MRELEGSDLGVTTARSYRTWWLAGAAAVLAVIVLAVLAVHFLPSILLDAVLRASAPDQSVVDASRGSSLSASDAASLEQDLRSHPDRTNERSELLGYYFGKEARPGGNDARAAWLRHILWLIDNDPQLEVLGTAFGIELKYSDGSGWDQEAAAWRTALARRADDARVSAQAAVFYQTSGDYVEAEALFRRAAGHQPHEPKWPARLAHMYTLEAQGSSDSATQVKYEQAALASLEVSHRLSSRDAGNYQLPELAKFAFLAGDLGKAHTYATAALSAYPPGTPSYMTGNAVHDGHMVLGRIAVREGNVDEGARELEAAGTSSGSPQLNSFGPNMSQALDLLQHGRSDAVLHYFDEVGRFWHQPELSTWRTEVQAGRTPNFGANLWY